MKYTAFISYNSRDDKWAKWLQRKLEAYNMPVVIRNEHDEIIRQDQKRDRFRIFRYRSDLNTISLENGLAKELDEARWLIVICTPNSARSEWVGKEIRHFIDSCRADHILPFIVEGVSYSGDDTECLNPALKEVFPPGDILGVNINDYGDDPRIYRKRKALVRIVSLLIELPDAYSYLWNRYRLRYWEGVIIKTFTFLFVIISLIWAWNRNMAFDSYVRLIDNTPYNSFLPSPEVKEITLLLDNESKKVSLSGTDTIVNFRNLPGKYAEKKYNYFFLLMDTCL